MSKLIPIICDAYNSEECTYKIFQAMNKGFWVRLISKHESSQRLIDPKKLPQGPGIIMRGGGSSGISHQCLLSYRHLDQSALATAAWLKGQGIEAHNTYILNSLPIHHVSGLMPWWRSKLWGGKYKWISPELMHNPNELEKQSKSLERNNANQFITSLVPTQLLRLMKHPAGIRWLQLCSMVWVGGSSLSEMTMTTLRELNIPIAPCYGTTETAAMVAVQSPKDFLSGNSYIGPALNDVELRLGEAYTLQIKTNRLARVIDENGQIMSIRQKDGWWESGDIAELIVINKKQQIKIIGRKDTAINSGGETIFPDHLQIRLLNAAKMKSIPIEEILLIPKQDKEWGERLVALVKIKPQEENHDPTEILMMLKNMVQNWAPYEKPIAWFNCPELNRNLLGKWELNKWKEWLKNKEG